MMSSCKRNGPSTPTWTLMPGMSIGSRDPILTVPPFWPKCQLGETRIRITFKFPCESESRELTSAAASDDATRPLFPMVSLSARRDKADRLVRHSARKERHDTETSSVVGVGHRDDDGHPGVRRASDGSSGGEFYSTLPRDRHRV